MLYILRSSPSHSAVHASGLCVLPEIHFSDSKNRAMSPVAARQRACLGVFRVKVPVSHYEEGLANINAVTEAPKPHGEGLKKG